MKCASDSFTTFVPTREALAPEEVAEARRLARRFVKEPELILACECTLDAAPSRDARVVLAAATVAVAARPSYADLHCYAAQLAFRAGALDEARTFIEQALRINPNYNDALVFAARIHLASGHDEPALAHLRRATTNGADYADVHLMVGDIFCSRNEVTEARASYERALQINPALAPALEKLRSLPTACSSGGNHELPA